MGRSETKLPRTHNSTIKDEAVSWLSSNCTKTPVRSTSEFTRVKLLRSELPGRGLSHLLTDMDVMVWI